MKRRNLLKYLMKVPLALFFTQKKIFGKPSDDEITQSHIWTPLDIPDWHHRASTYLHAEGCLVNARDKGYNRMIIEFEDLPDELHDYGSGHREPYLSKHSVVRAKKI